MPTGIGSAIVAGAMSTGAAALGFSTVIGGSLMTHFLVTTAIGAAINALTPKPSALSAASAAGGYTVTQSGSVADHQIVYGKTKAAGVRVFDATTGGSNELLHRVIAFTGHEVEDFEGIYLNDTLVSGLDSNGFVTQVILPDGPDPLNPYIGGTVSDRWTIKKSPDGSPLPPEAVRYGVRLKVHKGSVDQDADATLVSEVQGWTTSHRLRGISYIYARYEFNQDTFPNGVPELTAVIKGKKVYDPRTATTAWSDNPALCIRDYITNSTYGLGESTDNIDDTLFITAANVCDYYNYPTLSGSARYTINGSFTTAAAPYDLLQTMLSSMGGLAWYAQGKWRIKPAYWTDSVVSFNEDDLRSSISVSTRHSRRDNFNTVNGVWRGAESNWQVTDFPPVKNTDFIIADNNQELSTDLNLAFTSDVGMARRIANIYLERNRQQLTVMASFGMKAFQVQVGDNIKLSNTRFSWTDKEFEVVSWTFGLVEGNDLQVHMTLREISESVFDDIADGAIYERDNTTLPSPFFVTPVGVSVEAIAQVTNQKVSNIARITVTATSSVFISRVEVEFKKSSDSVWKAVGTGPVGVFEAIDLETGTYDFRARAINTFGVKGDWTNLVDQEVNAFIGDPSDVTNLSAELSGGTLFLSWTAIPDADLSHYVVKHNSSTTGATWSNSTTVVEKIPRPATSAALPARSGTYLIRAYDKEDNFSENVTTVIVLPSDLPQLGTTDTQTEDPTFAGTTSNAVVVSSSVEIDDTSGASPTGEYFFSNYIDTGSSRNARVTGYRTFERRYDDTTLLWDAIPQNWDTWPDLWDTWTNEDANFGDIGVTVYVATTNDDPAGTPTWGSWELANGSFYTGRAFKFKAVLESDNTNYTPAILTLSADVEY